MTPKQKAEELVNKFTLYLGTDADGNECYVSILDAKRCALIAIDTILDGNNIIFNKKYYDEVKQEIERL